MIVHVSLLLISIKKRKFHTKKTIQNKSFFVRRHLFIRNKKNRIHFYWKMQMADKFTKMMEGELKDLYRYAYYRLGDKQDAEDVIQDLYLSMYTICKTEKRIDNLKNYIYRALSINCTLLLRRRTQSRVVRIEDIEQMNIMDMEPKNLEEEFKLINILLDSIPYEQSEIIR